MKETVQDYLIADLLEIDKKEESNETVQVLEFMRDNATPMTKSQLEGILLLNENGLNDLANFAFGARKAVTPSRIFFDMVGKITLADRIKGSAKLSHLMKATANPAGSMKTEDLQAQGMKRSEIDK